MSNHGSWQIEAKLEEARDRIDVLAKALHEIIDMVDEQADVDDGMPNLAMRILVEAEKAL